MMANEHKFPLIAKNIETGSLVLFTDRTKGTVLMSKVNNDHIGFYTDSWTSVFDETVWELDFDKTIVIYFKNE